MAQLVLRMRVPCQTMPLVLLLLLLHLVIALGQSRGLQAASYCETKLAELAEEGLVQYVNSSTWVDDFRTVHQKFDDVFHDFLDVNGVRVMHRYEGGVMYNPKRLLFTVEGGGDNQTILEAVGFNISSCRAVPTGLTRLDGRSLMLGFTATLPMIPSSKVRDVLEFSHAEVSFHIKNGRPSHADYGVVIEDEICKDEISEPPSDINGTIDGMPPMPGSGFASGPRWFASAGYFIPFRTRKQPACATGSAAAEADGHQSQSHFVCLELSSLACEMLERPPGDCRLGLSVALPVTTNAHSFFAEGTMVSLLREGHPLHFQPTALTADTWTSKRYDYVLWTSEMHNLCPVPFNTPMVPRIFAIEWSTEFSNGGFRWRQYKELEVRMFGTTPSECLHETGPAPGISYYLECSSWAGTRAHSTVTTLVLELLALQRNGNRVVAALALNRVSESQETNSTNSLYLVGEGWMNVGDSSLCMVACWKRPKLEGTTGTSAGHGMCEDCKIGIKVRGPLHVPYWDQDEGITPLDRGKTFTILDRNVMTATVSSLRNKSDPFFFKEVTFYGHQSVENKMDYGRGNYSPRGKYFGRQQGGDAVVGSGGSYMFTQADVVASECDGGVALPGEAPEKISDPRAFDTAGSFFEFRGRGGVEFALDAVDVWNLYGINADGRKSCSESASGLQCVAYVGFGVAYAEWGGPWDSEKWDKHIEAEGTYDPARRRLCLIVCRSSRSPLHMAPQDVNNNAVRLKDCQISLTIVRQKSGMWKGAFRSLRNESDPLFFKPAEIPLYGEETDFSASDANEFLWVRDLEVMESLVAMTLTIVCIWRQARHSERNPKSLPQFSVTMLCVLAAGYAFPLIVKEFPGDPGATWSTIDTYQSDVQPVLRGLAILVVLLLFRLMLIQRASSGNGTATGEAEDSASWSEPTVFLISAALYTLAWLIADSVISTPRAPTDTAYSSSTPISAALVEAAMYNTSTPDPIRNPTSLPWSLAFAKEDRSKFVGVLLDWFLVPQVVAMALRGVVPQQPVSHLFCWGLTLVRASVHIHAIWRGRVTSFPVPAGSQDHFGSRMWNFQSANWDMLALGVSIMLATLLLFQQRLGGRFLCCTVSPTVAETELGGCLKRRSSSSP